MTDNPDAGWDQYWAHGFLTSCADAFKGNYEGTMRSTWEQAFAALPAGSRLLDVCTGNGAIALIAAAVSQAQDKQFTIEAFDRAMIFPERAARDDHSNLLESVRFHPRVDAASLPFSDRAFDFVSGHFALEYTDLARSIPEIARVCDTDASGLFIVHHAKSAILRTTAEEQRHLDTLRDSRLFEYARAFIGLVGNTAPKMRAQLQQLPHAEAGRERLNSAAARVTDAIADARHPELLRTALSVVSEAYQALGSRGLTAALARLEGGETEIYANAARLDDLVAAARTRKQMAAMESLFVANQFTIASVDTLMDENERLIGWTLRVRRAGS